MPSNKLLQAAAGSAGGDKLFVEDVFSTFLYAGVNAANTITNGLDLSGEGGLVWCKDRKYGNPNRLYDTARGVNKYLDSASTAAQGTNSASGTNHGIDQFNSNGFRIGGQDGSINDASSNFASFSWRKAEGWFDIVTYSGNGVNGRQLPHSLGSTPGMVVCKRTDTGQNWILQHKSLDLSGNKTMFLNNTDALAVANDYWNSTHASSTAITLSGNSDINGSGGTYVAYVFGEDAIFGEDGDEQICKMGSYTGNGSNTGPIIDCGFEPQWILIKKTSSTGGNKSWIIVDAMRGIVTGGDDSFLTPNESSAEFGFDAFSLTATGFQVITSNDYVNTNGVSYIYMAIRRPMKVPEAGTEVFQALTYSGTGTFPSGTDPNSGVATREISSSLGFDVDMSITNWRSGGSAPTPTSSLMDRFRGIYNELLTYNTTAETQSSNTGPRFSTRVSRAFDLHDYGVEQLNQSGQALVSYVFKRASKFMDVVAYTGNGTAGHAINHNLGVAPEMIWVKNRGTSDEWVVYASNAGQGILRINTNEAFYANTVYWNNTTPSSSTFSVGFTSVNNSSSNNYIAYLFATLAGVSKVGSVSHSGTTNVDCGFSAGARFVLVKRTDSTGDWYVWSTSTGLVAGDDPYLLLNSSAAEVTNTDYIDPLASGFTLTSSFTAGTYTFLAIA